MGGAKQVKGAQVGQDSAAACEWMWRKEGWVSSTSDHDVALRRPPTGGGSWSKGACERRRVSRRFPAMPGQWLRVALVELR